MKQGKHIYKKVVVGSHFFSLNWRRGMYFSVAWHKAHLHPEFEEALNASFSKRVQNPIEALQLWRERNGILNRRRNATEEEKTKEP